MKYLRDSGVVKTSGFCAAVLAAGLAVGVGFASNAPIKSGQFQIIYPEQLRDFKVKPCVADDPQPCFLESIALVQALSNLEAAEAAAEAALEAYNACVAANGGGPIPDPDPAPPLNVDLHSILESVN